MPASDRAGNAPGWWLGLALLGLATGAALLYSRFHEAESPEAPFLLERSIVPQAPTTDVRARPASEVTDSLGPGDLVLGVTLGGESRAYPLTMMNAEYARKILNDTLAGRPVLVTWCDACHNGIVFERQVDGRTLTFGVFGSLWLKSMTMRDEETGSVWSHFDGEGRLGPLKGVRLEVIPSAVTDWRSWVRAHPDCTVAWFDDERDKRMTAELYTDPGRLVLGVASGRRAKSWLLADLSKRGVINDTWDGRPVVAALVRGGAGARLYSREVGGRTVTFESRDGVPTDRETGTAWDALTGRAVEGELAGEALTPLPAMVSYRDAWLRFYSRSR
jgi:hypothetical protein